MNKEIKKVKSNENLSQCIKSLAHLCLYFYIDSKEGKEYNIQVSGIDVSKYLEV